MFGRLLDAPLIHPADKQSATDATIYLWSSQFQDEPYNIDLSQFPCLIEETKSAEHDFEENDERDESDEAVDFITLMEETTAIVYDLADAVSRQKSFYYQVQTFRIFCKWHCLISWSRNAQHTFDAPLS